MKSRTRAVGPLGRFVGGAVVGSLGVGIISIGSPLSSSAILFLMAFSALTGGTGLLMARRL